jgi:hypothetical protein
LNWHGKSRFASAAGGESAQALPIAEAAEDEGLEAHRVDFIVRGERLGETGTLLRDRRHGGDPAAAEVHEPCVPVLVDAVPGFGDVWREIQGALRPSARFREAPTSSRYESVGFVCLREKCCLVDPLGDCDHLGRRIGCGLVLGPGQRLR